MVGGVERWGVTAFPPINQHVRRHTTAHTKSIEINVRPTTNQKPLHPNRRACCASGPSSSGSSLARAGERCAFWVFGFVEIGFGLVGGGFRWSMRTTAPRRSRVTHILVPIHMPQKHKNRILNHTNSTKTPPKTLNTPKKKYEQKQAMAQELHAMHLQQHEIERLLTDTESKLQHL